MPCPQCGENQIAGALFCHKCGLKLDASGGAPAPLAAAQTLYPQKQGRGVLILILGILSIVLFGPLTGVPAWIMGHSDMKDIRAGRIASHESGLTNAGMVLGIVGTCLGALVFIGIFLAVAIAVIGASGV